MSFRAGLDDVYKAPVVTGAVEVVALAETAAVPALLELTEVSAVGI